MFNDCNSKTNGEYSFFLRIKDKVKTMFDIGCRSDSEFIEFAGEVHYFDPVSSFIDGLSQQKNKNSKSYFNKFGLGDETKELFYYPKYQSFYDRINSCKISDDSNKIILNIKTAKEYIDENNVKEIDFIKIDTEGYELHVLKGFGDYLKNIKIVQFEYGGTFLDNNMKLVDVINYLSDNDFHNFCYLVNNGLVPITDYTDHYQYCNIVCFNKKNTIEY